MHKQIRYLGIFAAVLFALTIVNVVGGGVLSKFGVLPRQVSGLIGIIFSPAIHGSWSHFINNILAFSILSFFLFQFGEKRYYRVLMASWLLTGIAVWLFARSSYHIGLSGIVYALWGYLLVYGVMRRALKSMIISFIVLVFYGSMVFGVFPIRQWMSFESHLFGALIGSYFGIYYARRDKKQAKKVIG